MYIRLTSVGVFAVAVPPFFVSAADVAPAFFAFPKAVRSRRALHTAAAAVVHVRIQCCLATTPILAGGEPGMARSTYVKCGICRSIYIFPGLITPHLPHMAHQS